MTFLYRIRFGSSIAAEILLNVLSVQYVPGGVVRKPFTVDTRLSSSVLVARTSVLVI